jgi:hypothetical protein
MHVRYVLFCVQGSECKLSIKTENKENQKLRKTSFSLVAFEEFFVAMKKVVDLLVYINRETIIMAMPKSWRLSPHFRLSYRIS